MKDRPTECPLCDLVLTYENFGVRECECGYRNFADGTTNQDKEEATDNEGGVSTTETPGTGDTQTDSSSDLAKSEAEEENKTDSEVEKSTSIRRDFNYVSPGMRSLPKVTVFAWWTGPIRGYHFGINCPYGNDKAAWQKEMTGIEAFQYLRGIQSANRTNRLESRELPATDKSE